MNRRDIIIIAVLINAGLLVVLFTTALKSDRNEPAMVVQTEMQAPIAPVQPPAAATQVKGDEVDQVLSQFAAVSTPIQGASAAATPLVQPIAVAPLSEVQPSASDSFIQEAQGLQSFATAPAPEHKVEAPASTPSFKEVKVKKGDALEKIARANRTSVQEIMRLNKLSSTQLKIGQVLKIPSKHGSSSASALAKNDGGESRIYTVKNGDNPWTIAVKNHMKLEELLQLNNLDEERARKLKPGDQLRIR